MANRPPGEISSNRDSLLAIASYYGPGLESCPADANTINEQPTIVKDARQRQATFQNLLPSCPEDGRTYHLLSSAGSRLALH